MLGQAKLWLLHPALSFVALAGSLSSQQVTGTTFASPWSGGHSTDFPGGTTAETRPAFNQQQCQTQEDQLFIAFFFRKVIFHMPSPSLQLWEIQGLDKVWDIIFLFIY